MTNQKLIKCARLKCLPILLGFISSTSFAWMCPSNFNQISEGSTIAEVTQQCGEPTSKNTAEKYPSVPQEWKYFIAVSQPYQMTYSPSPTTGAPNFSTVRMTVTFVSDRAINITVMDQSLSSTSICGQTINTGDSMKRIEALCGKPVFIQKQDNPNAKPMVETEFKYNTAPPNTFIFENGRLKSRK